MPLPSVVVQDAKGRTTTLKEILAEKKGTARLVLLHLWAPYCPPCVREMQQLDSLWPKLREKGVEIIILAQDPDGEITVPAFARRREIRVLPLFIDKERQALKSLASAGIPITYMLDTEGRMTFAHEGPLDWGGWLETLTP